MSFSIGRACHLLSTSRRAFNTSTVYGVFQIPRQRRKAILTLRCFASAQEKRKLVFLGTPEVAAQVLQDLLTASTEPGSSFEVAAVVSQPGRPRGRGNKRVPKPSPVEALALDAGFHKDRILCPVKASEEAFLGRLKELAPDLCVTAAYGNVLPTAFLRIPRRGTLNIHPSMLPLYRGAAPVQRALQDGCKETGVSVAFTVRKMDAGPVLAQLRREVDADIQAPELLSQLFSAGTSLLLEQLPSVWSGDAEQKAAAQDESRATHAAKLTKEEGELDFREPAAALHDKVRAFAGWPGTTAQVLLTGLEGAEQEQTIKVLRTRLGAESVDGQPGRPRLEADREGLRVLCGRDGDAGVLHILEVQPPNKRPMPVSAFLNGLNGRTLALAA